ncbi:MAG: ribosome recycling factor [Bacteroidales bacterium]|nr:ribosome recycling factor [Bacteroidales bacterium]
MKASIVQLLDSAKKKMSGYAALFNYRLMNLCVLASPEALLPVQVEVGGELLPIEQVAKARNAEGREDQFEIYPLDKDWLFPIVKGIADVHPEFKIEIKDLEDGDEEDLENKYILATMPPVDDVRHDVLTDAIGVLSDACDAKIKATFDYYSAQIPLELVGASAEDLDEAKNALQEVHDSHDDLCKQFRAAKEKEIEDAYQQFLAEKAEKQAKFEEEVAARNEQAAQQMKWTPESE